MANFRSDLKGRQQAAFRRANPDAFGRAGGNGRAIEQLAAIERRAANIRDKVRSHFNKYEESWVAKEAISIWQRRSTPSAEHPAPQGAPGRYAAQSIMMEARHNVRARVAQRLSKVNGIKTRMANGVVRTTPTQSLKETPKLSAGQLPAIFKKRSIKL